MHGSPDHSERKPPIPHPLQIQDCGYCRVNADYVYHRRSETASLGGIRISYCVRGLRYAEAARIGGHESRGPVLVSTSSCVLSGGEWSILVFEHHVGRNEYNQWHFSVWARKTPKTLNT